MTTARMSYNDRDIILRLRSAVWHGTPFSKDAFDAADEIEQLRAQQVPCSASCVEVIADAIDAARYAHPTYPRERPRPFLEADGGDREYATRLAKAALLSLRKAGFQVIPPSPVAENSMTAAEAVRTGQLPPLHNGNQQSRAISAGDNSVER